MKSLYIAISILLLSSCAYKNSPEETNKYIDQFGKDSFPYKGNYVWAFNLMGGEQVSTHSLYPDSIIYTMTGKVYSASYTIQKLSYEQENSKWIGEDENGIVYVLFFKEKTDSTLTIYKHKCKTKGLEEALHFDMPAPDATDDHGWNVYSINKDDTRDVLPIAGHFSNAENIFLISDSILTFNQKEVKKMSFHSGERRWVGQYQDQYLQVFFKHLNPENTIQLSATWSNNLEELYNTKYKSVDNWKTYTKQ